MRPERHGPRRHLEAAARATVRFLALLPLLAVIASCTSIRPVGPVPPPGDPLPAGAAFHADLHVVLQHFVDEQGRVDYPALAGNREVLDRYYALLTRVSPDTHPEHFPTDDDRLAYWLNAYNASVLTTVLRYYPIASVRDVGPPKALCFLPRLSGFFLFQHVTLGGRSINLYDLEHRVVRKRFADPRVHFALNCASASCPHLPRAAFTGERLDTELERETRRFVGEARNVRIDAAARTIALSSIFDWYEDDFLDWLETEAPDEKPSLEAYVARYLPVEAAEALQACDECTVQFIPYDWGLNDQHPTSGAR